MTIRFVQSTVCVLAFATIAVWLTGSVAARQSDADIPHRTDTGAGPAAVELGRLLFWDPLLSGHRDVACATCHHPEFAYADGRDLSLGPGAAAALPVEGRVENGR